MGRIAENVKSIIPITWDALLKDERIGDPVLQARISYAMNLVLGEEPDDDAQKDLHPLVVEFVAKTSVLELIDTAIDLWMIQPSSLVQTGSNEQETFPDRIAALQKLRERILVDLAKLEPIVEPLIPVIKKRRSSGAPLISTIDDDLLTPNPQDIGPLYGPKVKV